MAHNILHICKALLLIFLAMLALLAEHWLILAGIVFLALLHYPWLSKFRDQSAHDTSQSPLNNLLNNTDSQTVRELMDFGL